MEFVKKYLTEIVLILGIFVVFGVTAIFNDAYTERFFDNVTTLILRPAAILGIFALGAAVVIIAGGIDLSSGSMIALSASLVCITTMVFCKLLQPDADDPTGVVPVWVVCIAALITIGVAILVGSLHAWLITVVQLPPFVATLASLVGLRSLSIVMNKAVSKQFGAEAVIVNIQDSRYLLTNAPWWLPLAIFLTLALILWLILNFTVMGRHIYAMGGNETAARLSGIRTDRLKWFAYCFAAVTASIAGMLLASSVLLADPQSQGTGGELFAIAAAVIGGCSLSGGVGRVSGVVLGALFLRVVIDAVAKLITSGNSANYEGMIVGLLVVLAVALNEVTGSSAGWRKQFFPGALGVVALISIGLLFGSVIAFSLTLSDQVANSWLIGIIVALVTSSVLSLIKLLAWQLGKTKSHALSKL
ncbi:MAG TPA: ABC transporter permease [Pirellulaceae bacterium]|nr:ABC transporter permease [Pirellulaceae bacterium]HMO91175.1 ABC transporter permease [Pirellulaceae bacterium]HMP69055.1 ABC transporter permease [Pirellulaceae bacterium]